jgi:hypothetical protein
MRRIRSDCSACVASGQTAADPAIPLMRSRRRIACPEAQDYANTPDYIRDLPPAKWGSEAALASKRQAANRPQCPLSGVKRNHADILRCPLLTQSGHAQLKLAAVQPWLARSLGFASSAERPHRARRAQYDSAPEVGDPGLHADAGDLTNPRLRCGRPMR